MRAARLILIAVAMCAFAGSLGALALVAANGSDPDLGPGVHIEPTSAPAQPTNGPSGQATDPKTRLEPGAPAIPRAPLRAGDPDDDPFDDDTDDGVAENEPESDRDDDRDDDERGDD